jgi:biotin carboxyl carrier protein
MLDKMGFNNVTAKQVKEIKAPMPGLVVEVSVQEGQEVVEGERLLILEAMKMENSIILHAPATIKKILVKKGQPVDKNQVLIELE